MLKKALFGLFACLMMGGFAGASCSAPGPFQYSQESYFTIPAKTGCKIVINTFDAMLFFQGTSDTDLDVSEHEIKDGACGVTTYIYQVTGWIGPGHLSDRETMTGTWSGTVGNAACIETFSIYGYSGTGVDVTYNVVGSYQ